MTLERGCHCSATRGACKTEFQYAVKLLCGELPTGPKAAPQPVAPGRYWTAVNIHNPDKCSQAILRWKVAVADQNSFVSSFQPARGLNPDAALEIDCPQVMAALPSPSPPFVKGYLVIESNIELDVVAVYTTAQASGGAVSTLHTERVPPRCVPFCDDLVLPIHTGFANWQTMGGPNPGPVALVNPLASAWATPPFGSSWVSQHSTDGQAATFGIFTYELCFTLCSGYLPPAPFPIQVLADGNAQVALNSTSFNVGAASSWTVPTTLTVNPSFLHVGPNCFRIQVTNGGKDPTGFAVAGILRVARGKCPCSELPILPVPGP
jgi:hypothetical protein